MPGDACFLLIVLLKNFRLRRWMFSPDTLPDENVREVWLCAMVFWDWCSYVGAYCCSRSREICGAFPFAFLFLYPPGLTWGRISLTHIARMNGIWCRWFVVERKYAFASSETLHDT